MSRVKRDEKLAQSKNSCTNRICHATLVEQNGEQNASEYSMRVESFSFFCTPYRSKNLTESYLMLLYDLTLKINLYDFYRILLKSDGIVPKSYKFAH